MEKIRSGQSFLYRENGLNGTVIDVRLKDKVRGDFLTRALLETLKRYPYLTQKLVEKDGDFFLENDPHSITAIRTDKFRVLGSMSTGYHLLDVTYFDHSIRIAFHHALCDGRGIKPFIETLVYYYCCMRYNKKLDSSGIRLAGEPLLNGETAEPVGYERYEVDESNITSIDKTGFTLPENADVADTYYRTEINFNQQSYIDYAKSIGATPAILLSMLVSSSIKKLYPNAQKPIVCSMATDYRAEIGMNNTHKNCVGSIYLPYKDETAALPLAEQSTHYRSLMEAQKTPDAVKAAINVQIGLYDKLDTIQTLEGKREMMSFFNDMCIDTYVISYQGQYALDVCREYIDSMHIYNSGVPGLRINMIAVGHTISVDVLECFQSDSIVKALLAAIDETKIEYTAIERIPFETVKDRAFITASRQAERYRITNKNEEDLFMSKIMDTQKKIEDGVTTGFKKIEDGVVGGYKAIETGVVEGYKKIEDQFVDTFLDGKRPENTDTGAEDNPTPDEE